jgi:hypothetical protein
MKKGKKIEKKKKKKKEKRGIKTLVFSLRHTEKET